MIKPSQKHRAGTVIFDLETQKSFAEVGGRQNIRNLLLSLAVVYRYKDEDYHTFLEKDARSLLKELRNASRVVGFNLLEFDYAVLERYGSVKSLARKTVDIMKVCEAELGWRPKLDDLAVATLRAKKGRNGLQAIEMFKKGELQKLEEYCKRDVVITRKLFEFGQRNRFLRYFKYGEKQKVKVAW